MFDPGPAFEPAPEPEFEPGPVFEPAPERVPEFEPVPEPEEWPGVVVPEWVDPAWVGADWVSTGSEEEETPEDGDVPEEEIPEEGDSPKDAGDVKTSRKLPSYERRVDDMGAEFESGAGDGFDFGM